LAGKNVSAVMYSESGGMLNLNHLEVDGRCDLTLMSVIKSALKKFCEYLSVLTDKGLIKTGRQCIHVSLVGSCLMNGSETWLMNVDHEV